MNKRILLVSLLATIPSLCSCGESETYSVDKLSIEHTGSYQLWDNFDYSKLKVSYDGVELETYQYNVDFTNFSTSSIGSKEITVSLTKSPETKVNASIEVTNRTSGNILVIGDSFTEDTIAYANEIINANENTSINVYGAYSNGSNLEAHFDAFVRDQNIYNFLKYDADSKSWTSIADKSLKEILTSEGVEWDMISLQQETLLAGQKNSFLNLNSYVSSIKSYISSQNKKAPSIGYNMPWAYQDGVTINNGYFELYDNKQDDMYNAIASATQDSVVASNLFNFIIPTGTSIQNLRTTSIASSTDFTSNGVNLDSNCGRYTASLCLASKLTGYTADQFTFRGEDGSELVSEDEQKLIYKTVDFAIDSSYQITVVE